MCLAAEELVALGALARLPHELVQLDPLDLAFDVEVLRAARKYRMREAASDMEQVGDEDAFGVGRVLALLYRGHVMGGG